MASRASLTDLVGLGGQVPFHAGDACDLPFADGRFDLAWTQHAVMNIADRPRLYSELHRVLRPGGRLAMYDVVIGDGSPVMFPVPWARLPTESSLMAPAATRTLLGACGFDILDWRDVTEASGAWLAARRPVAPAVAPRLGLHLLLGPEFAAMSRNYGRNVLDGRVGLVMAVAQKRPS